MPKLITPLTPISLREVSIPLRPVAPAPLSSALAPQPCEVVALGYLRVLPVPERQHPTIPETSLPNKSNPCIQKGKGWESRRPGVPPRNSHIVSTESNEDSSCRYNRTASFPRQKRRRILVILPVTAKSLREHLGVAGHPT